MRTPTRSPGAVGADAVDDRVQKPRAVLERPAVTARSRARAQQLVAEVAVAVLHVDEGEARAIGGESRGGDELLDQPVEVVIREAAARR